MATLNDIARVDLTQTNEVVNFSGKLPVVSLVEVVVSGPQGPQGPSGYVEGVGYGQPRWVGQGPPGLLIGAEPGDRYLDTLTGDIYKNE